MSTSARQRLRALAVKRLQKETTDWQKNPPAGFQMIPTDDLQNWTILLTGAPGTFYEGEEYRLQFEFPDKYPMQSPEVIFLQPPPIHPHIYSNGHICLDILYDGWSPAMSAMSVCISILSMMSSADKKERPPDNDEYVKKCGNKRPKRTNWEFHDDKA